MSLSTEQLSRLKTLQESLSALTDEYQDVIPLIQSAVKDGNDTVIGLLKDPSCGLNAIINKFEGNIAKQGTDDTATLSIVQNLLQSLVDAHVINNVNMEDWEFIEQGDVHTLGDAISSMYYVKAINDASVTTLSRPYLFRGCPYLERVSFPNLKTTLNGYSHSMFGDCAVLTDINLPKLTSYYGERFCNSLPKLEELYLPNLVSMLGNYQFSDCINLQVLSMPKLVFQTMNSWHGNCSKLIDFIIGNNDLKSFTINSWNPTEALRDDSTSLIKDGESFSSNKEKLLYNIRNHIAANLPDRTGQTAYTATFTANIKAAILSDTATAQAFTNKNWTIA